MCVLKKLSTIFVNQHFTILFFKIHMHVLDFFFLMLVDYLIINFYIYLSQLLGLNECADITVGDEMRRGISGGQKRRVTIGK